MYDSTDPQAIPVSVPAVAGYVDGIYGPNHAQFGQPGWDAAAWDRFPTSLKVRISCLATNAGDCLDIEAGCARIDQVRAWILGRQVAGVVRPILYVNRANWDAVRTTVTGLNVLWWIATLNGTQNVPGADAVQYAGSNLSGGNYDLSLCNDAFFGGDMTPEEHNMLSRILGAVADGVQNIDGVPVPSDWPNFLGVVLRDIQAKVSAPATVDVNALAAALASHPLMATLSDAERAAIAVHVRTELAAQLAKP